MTRSPTEIVARAVHDNDAAYAPPYWDDCYPEMQRFYLEMAEAALAALAGEGWTLIRRDGEEWTLIRRDGEEWTLIRRDEAVAVQCPRCEGNGEHLSHLDQDCDVCADPRDWGKHVVECERCAGGGETLAWLMPYEEEEE